MNIVVFNNKNISVDSNANGQEFVANIDEVIEEIENNTQWDVIQNTTAIQNIQYQSDTVKDSNKGIYDHHPVQYTNSFLHDDFDQVSIADEYHH